MIFLIALCVILFVIAVGLAVRLVTVKYGMCTIKHELILTREKDYNRQITVTLTDNDLMELAAEINRTLDLQKRLKYETEAAEAVLKQSVSDIAHDLRTPLTVLKGNLQMLRGEEGVSEHGKEYLRISEEKCTAMKNIADDFFEMSVLESDSIAVKAERINLTVFLMQSIADSEAVIIRSGLTPEITFPEKSVFVHADSALLSRMFGNLLNNTVKYAKGSFGITLTENGCITFSNYVSPENAPDPQHLFFRTYRADNTRNGGGAGLGLYIVKLLAEKQGGNVSAEYENKRLKISVQLTEAAAPKDSY